jgi:hypothetical protein
MRHDHAIIIAVAVGAVAMGSAAAVADGVPITITNDGTDDVVVTVYDLNSQTRNIVMQGERINGFTSVPISVTPGPDGLAHVAWKAINVNGLTRKCGSASRVDLGQDATVHVRANKDCAKT